jgi:quercetin dioxygenase-like cupin family protein
LPEDKIRQDTTDSTLHPCGTTREGFVLDVILKRFERPDEVRTFDKGRFELVRLGGLTIGRATYEPGWRWSEHVGRALQQVSCDVEHVGIVISGRAAAAMTDGRVVELRAGDIFHVPGGHDSWVVGDEPYVSIHLIGAAEYATHAVSRS